MNELTGQLITRAKNRSDYLISNLAAKTGRPKALVTQEEQLAILLETLVSLTAQQCVELCEAQVAGAVGTYAGTHNAAVKKCCDAINQQFET